MRIIAGKHKGRKLNTFEGLDVRPTGDKAREALFAIFGNINNLNFLDLCCGTGAMGLEAESRGANVTLVDNSKQSLLIVSKNAKLVSSNAKIVNSDILKFLTTTQNKYDIIFCDPPYPLDLCGQVVKIISDRNLLSDNGVLVYEKDGSQDCSYGNIVKLNDRKYGKAIFGFYGVKL